MFRFIGFAGFTASLLVSTATFAADYPDAMRGTYPTEWSNETDEMAIGFEAGVRYWYSVGGQENSFGSNKLNSESTAHSGEAHVRIDDYTTSTWLRSTAGLAFALDTTYTVPDGNGGTESGASADGQLGYVSADFGTMFMGDTRDGMGIGVFAGYKYLNDNPDVGRANYTTAASASDIAWSTNSTNWSVPGDSELNSLHINQLRLGVAGKATINDMFDISAEVAAVPFAYINGTLGAYAPLSTTKNGSVTTMLSSATEVNGWGYGGEAEVMVGFHPTENVAIRVGGRASYLQGVYSAEYETVTISDQVSTENNGIYDQAPTLSTQRWVRDDNFWSQWRVGALAELSVKF